MLAIGTLDGTLPCTGCGKKISKGEWGTSNGSQDFCKECSDKKWNSKSNKPTPRFVDNPIDNIDDEDKKGHAIYHCHKCATYDNNKGWLGNSCILKFTDKKTAPLSNELNCPLLKIPNWKRRE